MESLLSEVENNQKHLVTQLEELKIKNKNLLVTFGLKMPSEEGLNNINGEIG
jgi:hypothetical protein